MGNSLVISNLIWGTRFTIKLLVHYAINLFVNRMGMQVPTTWQGIHGQPQIQTTPQQIAAAPGTTMQQPGLVFPIQQYQVSEEHCCY